MMGFSNISSSKNLNCGGREEEDPPPHIDLKTHHHTLICYHIINDNDDNNNNDNDDDKMLGESMQSQPNMLSQETTKSLKRPQFV
jgi:hypothetical protein